MSPNIKLKSQVKYPTGTQIEHWEKLPKGTFKVPSVFLYYNPLTKMCLIKSCAGTVNRTPFDKVVGPVTRPLLRLSKLKFERDPKPIQDYMAELKAIELFKGFRTRDLEKLAIHIQECRTKVINENNDQIAVDIENNNFKLVTDGFSLQDL